MKSKIFTLCFFAAIIISKTSFAQGNGIRCGTINGPVYQTTSMVSGLITSISPSTKVTLYEDGIAIGNTTISDSVWTIPVNINIASQLRPGSNLTISTTLPAQSEVFCTYTQQVICETPAQPVFSPQNTVIGIGESVTYTIESQPGVYYIITDETGNNNLSPATFGNGSTITVTTNTFNQPGTYNVKLKAYSGSSCFSTSDASIVATGLLPLNLVSFTAGRQSNGVLLSWTTAYEQGVQSYEIERGSNTANFKTIATIKAVGNSQRAQHYTYSDERAGAAVWYYRLKIKENNTAAFKYSSVVIVRSSAETVITAVAPNPFMKSVSFTYESPKQSIINVKVSDMTGRAIKSSRFTAHTGTNLLVLDGLQDMPAGVYNFEIIADGVRTASQMLVKN